MSKTSSGFAVDMDGLRKNEGGRPLYEVVREVIQNGLDAAKSRIDVSLEKDEKRGEVVLIVEDDGDGLPSLGLATTLYAGTKADDPTKRGRMGRGLKEAIVVADASIVQAPVGEVRVTRHKKGVWSVEEFPRRKRESGTRVKLAFRTLHNNKVDVNEAVAWLRRIVPPEGVTLTLNGTPNEGRAPASSTTYEVELPTVVVDSDGVERTRSRKTMVVAFEPIGTDVGQLYELGVPIQPLEYPRSLDVQQRVPMPPQRNTVRPEYLQKLYAQLLNHGVATGEVRGDELSSKWVMDAAQQAPLLNQEAAKALTDYYTRGALVANTRAEQLEAENFHIPSVYKGAIPQAVREVVLSEAPRTRDRLEEIRFNACMEVGPEAQSMAERAYVRVTEEIFRDLGRHGVDVVLKRGKVSFSATFDPKLKVFTVYLDQLPKGFVDDPLSERAFGLLLHEGAHWDGHSHEHVHGPEFHTDLEALGARLAWLMLTQGEKYRRMVKEE